MSDILDAKIVYQLSTSCLPKITRVAMLARNLGAVPDADAGIQARLYSGIQAGCWTTAHTSTRRPSWEI